MRGDCENCGGRTYDGICANCHEELDIMVNQCDDLDDVRLSDDFLSRAKEQAIEAAENRAATKSRKR